MAQRNLFDLDNPPLPPRQRHSPTSEAAADSVASQAATWRRRVLEELRRRGAEGATDEEGAAALGLAGNTYRPRRIELVQAGLVVDSGAVRATSSGRAAVVWVASEVRDAGSGAGRLGQGEGLAVEGPQGPGHGHPPVGGP